uniref:Uncharacterized protein n=1 Tax=Brassica oleracea var. oleracea TaxID=109376 RepID=A0A0D3BBC1_BRAOL
MSNFVIHGFIPAGRAAGRANHYMSSLKAGSVVKDDRLRFLGAQAYVVGQIRSDQGFDLSKETTRVVIRLLQLKLNDTYIESVKQI